MKTSNRVLIVMALIASIPLQGCKKFLEIETPKEYASSELIYDNESTANSSIVGIYSEMIRPSSGIFGWGLTTNCGMASDELSRYNLIDPYFQNNVLSSDQQIEMNWGFLYSYIYSANLAIEGLQNSKKITSPVKNQLIAEAKFLRALNYFYLVNLWGDVPLIISTDYELNQQASRTSATIIYDQIKHDLLDASNSLPENYTTSERIRANKYAAKALLARVYLYQKDWVNAELQATSIIASSNYHLESLENVFLKNNSEAILQLKPVNPNNNTWDGLALIPSATFRPLYPLTNSMLNAFENGDLRKSNWVNSKLYNGLTSYYPAKYKIKNGGSPLNEYTNVFRLAEQYLIRAEARANQNKIGDAVADLNLIRKRARGTNSGMLPDLSANISQLDCLNATMQERKVELFAEWGQRWFDLKRTGKIDEVLSIAKGTSWQSTDQLWPIPLSQLKVSPFLSQNPGYN